ncbi:MAG: PLP-dependent aminotransferase family protein [Enterococcus lacertideformus]|uniref:PLP-dependent aminotransferase family protein n=1 Tax=Enterococcus lacertideformus TaxID=2771493 RepID=A0A931AY58_9ENTE|nr:PLP-dependent aminotransferase family protein [Enterococcus lacertideformus]
MWEIVDKKHGTIYRQIMEQIMSNIEKGKLIPGDPLPSERKLAQAFQVNRTTVVHALDELRDLGVLVSRRGSGRYINQTQWGRFLAPRVNWRDLFSQRYEQADDGYENRMIEEKKQTGFLDLFSSEMQKELLPNILFPAYSMEAVLEEEQQMTYLGYRPLVKEIKEYLVEKFYFDFSTTDLLITSGGQQAIFLILQTILSNGDAIAVETPSFFYRMSLFKAAGIRLFGVPMYHEGIDLEKLELSIQKNKFKAVLVNPNFQNPTGKVMSQKRRKELVTLCQKYQLQIIEDDVFSDLSFHTIDRRRLTSIHSIDPENVLYIGSLSRVLGRTTKVGWIVGLRSFIAKLANAQEVMEFSMSIFTQMAARSVFEESYDTKIEVVRKELYQKSRLLIKWAKGQSFFKLSAIDGGYYAWITWEGRKLTKVIAEELIHSGLGIAPSFLFGEDIRGLRINFSRLNENQLLFFKSKMAELAQRLAE